MTSDNLDPFLAKMAAKKVELDGIDRKLAGAGVSNESWGDHVVSAGNYIEAAHSSKAKGGRSIG